jgi:hypothetical protein
MPGMACRLLDEVEQDPPRGAGLRIGKPRFRWQGYTATEVADAADNRIGACACLFVSLEDRG